MKNLFILLLLLMTVVTGTWAQIGLRIPLTLEATTDGTIMVCAQGDCPRVHFFTSLLGGLKDF